VTSPARRAAAGERIRRQSPFAADLKHELARHVPARACCQLSELQGFAAAAPVRSGDGQVSFRVSSSVAARKAVRLTGLLEGGHDDARSAGHYLRGVTRIRPTYRVSIGFDAGGRLAVLATPATAPTRNCCRRSFLRGAYLAGGNVSLSASGYHFEMTFASIEGAAVASEALAELGIGSGRRDRGRRRLLYIKSSEDLVTALKLMGAGQAVLRFENDRILREMRAQANRQANVETANLRRVVGSGLKQTVAARRLGAAGLLNFQPLAIREIASARLAMPAASLSQVAARLGLSRSAANARLRRLVASAQEAGLVDLD
jgi:DNA-binding protein WhiA